MNYGDERVFQFEIIIDVLVSSFWFLWKTMLWVYGHYKYFNSFSAGTVFIRQNLTSVDVRFWRIKTVPALKGSRSDTTNTYMTCKHTLAVLTSYNKKNGTRSSGDSLLIRQWSRMFEPSLFTHVILPKCGYIKICKVYDNLYYYLSFSLRYTREGVPAYTREGGPHVSDIAYHWVHDNNMIYCVLKHCH